MNSSFPEYIEKTLNSNPFFLIGSGLSMGAGISGMGRLAEYLDLNVSMEGFSDIDLIEWEAIRKRLKSGIGLERALQDSQDKISNVLTGNIVKETWRLIANDERRNLFSLAAGEDVTGFCRLFKKYRHTVHNKIHILTTNYDHLIEWSASIVGWPVWDGFDNGLIASPLYSSDLTEKMMRLDFKSKKTSTVEIPHVRIYKPHGSISWFYSHDGRDLRITNASPTDLQLINENGFSPRIVTPGIGKYLETHGGPYSNVMSEITNVIINAQALICIGFGFNDEHIQAKFQGLFRNEHIPKIIITRSFSPKLIELITESKIRNFVAIDEVDCNSSRVNSDRVKSGIIPTPNLWTFKEIMKIAWGDDYYEG